MRIEYFHASKHGNGANVAAHFRETMAAAGITVDVHDVRGMDPARLPDADLYVFSSPGRIGKPIGTMRKFLRRAHLREGAPYALLTTEAAIQPNKKTGELPSDEEIAKRQRVRPILDEILADKGLTKVGEEVVFVTGLTGPLEEGWESKVEAFAHTLVS